MGAELCLSRSAYADPEGTIVLPRNGRSRHPHGPLKKSQSVPLSKVKPTFTSDMTRRSKTRFIGFAAGIVTSLLLVTVALTFMNKSTARVMLPCYVVWICMAVPYGLYRIRRLNRLHP